MPATEKTWRDTRLLHRVFAASSLVLLFATILLFAKDHAREWKTHQRTARKVNLRLTAWRQLQFETEDAVRERHALQAELRLAKAAPIDVGAVESFVQILQADYERRSESPPNLETLVQRADKYNQYRKQSGIDGDSQDNPFARFSQAFSRYGDLRDQLEQARSQRKQAETVGDEEGEKAAVRKITQLENKLAAAKRQLEEARKQRQEMLEKLAKRREAVLDALKKHYEAARFREETALKSKQFATADLDAARANVGLALRDGRPAEELQRLEHKARELKETVDRLELAYQQAQTTRRELEDQIKQLESRAAAIEKKLEDNLADLERLNRAIKDERSTYFVNGFWPGKKWLELPILDAFNSPLKIDNLWAEDLEQPLGSFARPRRYDRCTTCHNAIDKTMPGTADVPALEPAEVVDFVLRFDDAELAGAEEETADADKDADELVAILGEKIAVDVPENERELRRTVGVILADEGLIRTGDVTVQFVQPQSPAARAEFDLVRGTNWQATATELTEFPLQPHRELRPAEIAVLPGALPNESELRLTLRGNGGDTVLTLAAETEIEDAYRQFAAAAAKVGAMAVLDGETIVLRSHDVGPDAFVALTAEGESATDFLEYLSAKAAFGVNLRPPRVVPGLKVGDVLLAINDDPVKNRNWAVQRLMDAARSGETLRLKVRRGLEHPYATHPRLDLFLGSLSPHKKSDFACTVCHMGQGSATDFKWASHTPDSLEQEEDWRKRLGWFDNVHWIYPMFPKRFAESGCVKCHHEMVELEPSDRFPEAPAPKVTQGYHLVRKFGCYGCHEINGFKGPGQRQGPDLRLEPNYYAAAQQFRGAAGTGYDRLTDEEKSWLEELIEHPEQDAVRHRVLEMIQQDAAIAAKKNRGTKKSGAAADADSSDSKQPQESGPSPRFSREVHTKIASLLADIETPGSLRRAGPALRYVGRKLDRAFLFDWILNPKRFRPSTKMPRFFGNYAHLDAENRAKGESLGKVEVAGIVEYLLHYSQSFDYAQPPTGITPVETDEEKQAQVARGKVVFERCLACHTHVDFADMAPYRSDDEIVQGPDLSYLGDKLKTELGRKWLYSWVKEPMRYHVRTVMPQFDFSPVTHRDADGKVTMVTDPAADVVAYLLSSRRESDQPVPYEFSDEALDTLALENLKERFHWTKAELYLKEGIPESLRSGLKGAEQELVIEQAERKGAPDFAALLKEKKLRYVGRKALSKYGCFGCHDIPGFEDAKPIGTGLADWGVKETSKLAFEHILQYLEHGHGHPSAAPAEHGSGEHPEGVIGPVETPPEFFLHQLKSHSRIGFLFQKLTEPRSYDYHVAENKRYNEWLRMPQFSFSVEQREAIMTFVLGLVADPPRAKYVYRPGPRQQAILEGKRLIEKYNCGGCHILNVERWELAYPADTFEPQTLDPTFPFVLHPFTTEELEKGRQVDHRGLMRSTVYVLPKLNEDGRPVVSGEYEGELGPLADDSTYDPLTAEFQVHLYRPAILSGHPYQVTANAISVRNSYIERRYGAWGGALTRYLLARVVAREKEVNPSAKGAEAWGWLPPPLIGEGEKIQTSWLHSFLLAPRRIRPAVEFAMPRFNLSSQEAAALADYFAAVDNENYPYEFPQEKRADYLARRESEYAAKLRKLGVAKEATDSELARRHLEDAMKIVISPNYCQKCHRIADYLIAGSPRGLAPNLADVQHRLRADYVRRWVGKPTSILPYTGMVAPIDKLDYDDPLLGTKVPQDLYHGDAIEQLDALVDLLMNFDVYVQRRAPITPIVEANLKSAKPAGGADQPESGGAEPPRDPMAENRSSP